ncbi:hypothetical protein BDP55DRAFT_85056 [Colletotrichum godetiae]|uniref:Uncharacterized protein n=1 Tax=Colletotrichum godetiae TaxID=1209918 RepID=A0AAJ0EZS1_9PEZI|nr:uncharacterized protein BDP55DRAFT_85056 [Colletotrichum godetiae]KAK1687732.1 hypothetical protein BDP55DRAFT_85056 [Colletotrichum godetiae]
MGFGIEAFRGVLQKQSKRASIRRAIGYFKNRGLGSLGWFCLKRTRSMACLFLWFFLFHFFVSTSYTFDRTQKCDEAFYFFHFMPLFFPFLFSLCHGIASK